MFSLKKNKTDAASGKTATEPGTAGGQKPDKEGTALPETPKIDINQYQDPEGLSVGKMNIGLWLAENRRRLSLVPVVALVVISAIAWAYTLFEVSHYLIWGRAADERMVEDLLSTNIPGHDFFLARSAQNLRFGNVQIFDSDIDNRYDFLVEVVNSNENHRGYFDYGFLVDGVALANQSGFILPGERKYLYHLGAELAKKPLSARLNLPVVGWQRIDKHSYPDWAAFKNERLDFTIGQIEFLPAKSTVLSERLNLNNLSFTARNNSPFNYREVDLLILLTRQDEIAGVNAFLIRNLMSGENRNVDLTWPGRLGRVDEVKIMPELDITSKDIYIRFEGDPASPIR